jgi:hypothetical protein
MGMMRALPAVFLVLLLTLEKAGHDEGCEARHAQAGKAQQGKEEQFKAKVVFSHATILAFSAARFAS